MAGIDARRGRDDRGAPLSALERAAWRGLLGARFAVLRELEDRLIREHGISTKAFDVMTTIAAVPGEAAMSSVARRVLVSPSGLTRVVARLEREGFVERRRDARDARVWRVSLTAAGRERLAAAERTHRAVVRERFADRISDERLRQLAQAWAELDEAS